MTCLRSAWFVLAMTSLVVAQSKDAPPVQQAELGNTRNVHQCGNLFLAGQPTADDIRILKQRGIKRVLTLRTDGEVDWDQAGALRDAGIDFAAVPFRAPETLTDDVFDKVRKFLSQDEKLLLHCGSANRVGAVWMAHRVLDQGVSLEQAEKEAKQVGLRTSGYLDRAREYIDRKSADEPEKSVRPGINRNFLANDFNIDQWVGRFEVESREIFAARLPILAACKVKSGSRVADVGAGTGLFTRMFSGAVGDKGWVYAVDISPGMLQHINMQAQTDSLTNVTTVLCPENSINLPPDSVDTVFICDTYHHFEYPKSSLKSIHHALSDGGSLVVIDFERIPGKSREFIMGHVRAGKETFRAEIEAAGFEFVEEVKLDRLRENYFLRFRKK